MTRSYLGRLGLVASVPENKNLEPLLKASVLFSIYCPYCGPKRTTIKKNGFDGKHADNPQKFYCKRCKSSFYAHTSWIFHVLADIICERILMELLVKNWSAISVAKKYHLSPAVLSNLVQHCEQFVQQKVQELKQRLNTLKQTFSDENALNKIIWWDETFFRISNQHWCLILLINSKSEVLAWKFGKTRTEQDYQEVLTSILDILPEQPIFVGDGWNAFEKACKSLKRNCILIQHIHSHPWKYARLHSFHVDHEKQKIVQTSLNIDYDAFLYLKQQEGRVLIRQYDLLEQTQTIRPRGRPKGSKNRHKRHVNKSKMFSPSHSKASHCGKLNIVTRGKKITFNPENAPHDWQLKLADPALRGKNFTFPVKNRLEELLSETFVLMKGFSIVSNPIEAKNSTIKRAIPRYGLKAPEHLQRRLKYYFLGTSSVGMHEQNFINLSNPLSPKSGFTNLLQFFLPRVADIEVISS